MLSPVALSDLDLDAIVYDGSSRPLCCVKCVVECSCSSRRGGVGNRGFVSGPGCRAGVTSESFGYPGTDLRMNFVIFRHCKRRSLHFRNPARMSPSPYPALAVPELCSLAFAMRVSPVPFRVVNSLPTIDVFPMHTMSPAVSYYEQSTSQ